MSLYRTYPTELFDPPPLETRKRERLLNLCQELGLPSSVASEIEAVARELQVFERHTKPHIGSEKSRSDVLVEIARRADELFRLVGGLSTTDLVDLVHLQRSPPDLVGPPTYYQFTMHSSIAAHVSKDLQHLSAAASILADARTPKGGAGGRRSMHKHYGRFIADLWLCVDGAEDLSLGRGGKFNRLCNEVFDAAGVHARADGALRHFVETRCSDDEQLHQARKLLDE